MNNRIDHEKNNRRIIERNRKIIYATQSLCALCGNPVDFKLKAPNPLSPTLDHIIPIAKGGHPTDIENLQLTHWQCNNAKRDNILTKSKRDFVTSGNRNLPQSCDWTSL